MKTEKLNKLVPMTWPQTWQFIEAEATHLQAVHTFKLGLHWYTCIKEYGSFQIQNSSRLVVKDSDYFKRALGSNPKHILRVDFSPSWHPYQSV